MVKPETRFIGDGLGDLRVTGHVPELSAAANPPPTKLDIGCGTEPRDGFAGIDRKLGCQAYPLAWPDGMPVQPGSIDEIYASHVLEHFSHRDTLNVLLNWASVLKAGGVIRIAVPDFDFITRAYDSKHAGSLPLEQYLFGSHSDANDHHGAMFNRTKLSILMAEAGFGEIEPFTSDATDCSALQVSLNLMGRKGARKYRSLRGKVAGCFSVPRLGFMDTMFCAQTAFRELDIPTIRKSGAFWGQCLQGAIELQLEHEKPEYILTLDYDSLFTAEDILAMYRLMESRPDIDALCPVQCGRDRETPLMTVAGIDGKARSTLLPDEVSQPALKLRSGHFGLTFLRASSLRKMPKPWFMHKPCEDGTWGDGRLDDDTYFWVKWAEQGLTLYQANRVAIGHLQLVASFPGRNMDTQHMYVSEYNVKGKPEWAWR